LIDELKKEKTIKGELLMILLSPLTNDEYDLLRDCLCKIEENKHFLELTDDENHYLNKLFREW